MGTKQRTPVRDDDRTIDLRDDRGRARSQPGADADSPTDIPREGWKQVLKRSWAETKADNVPMLAGGVAFFAFLALFPALIAVISIWGLVVGQDQATQQAERLTEGLPPEASGIIEQQMENVASQQGGGLTLGLVVSVLLALWSASGGTANLMKAVNVAYDEEETRGFVKLRGLALLLTLGAIVFVGLAVALVAVVPPLLDALGLGVVGTVLAQVARWVLLAVLVTVALAVVYRFAPDRDDPKVKWASLGAGVATVLWLLGSVAFSLYVANFGSYNETYGAIAGVAILLLWLFLTAFIVLLGAEINAESERQTLHDTTVGEPRPMGTRDAAAADSLPEDADRDRVDR
ncbi:YihY/virulence factor BrkB family protein [Aquipuribacter nitratireducens]|uniref:YihY/virulence factor BrkB family protein n=1 Tax=Aquipuribacter nitratireducens TaxID=650104 RepID=A0ABW0GMW3_9MICO